MSYLRASPACAELVALWEAQSSIKDAKVLPQLLLLMTNILAAESPPPAAAAAEADGVKEGPSTSGRSDPHTNQRRGGGTSAAATAAAAGHVGSDARSERATVSAAQSAIVGQVLSPRRLKSLYHCLGSEHAALCNAALALLAAVAAQGGAVRDLVAAFDWSLPALTRICRPYRWGEARVCMYVCVCASARGVLHKGGLKRLLAAGADR